MLCSVYTTIAGEYDEQLKKSRCIMIIDEIMTLMYTNVIKNLQQIVNKFRWKKEKKGGKAYNTKFRI